MIIDDSTILNRLIHGSDESAGYIPRDFETHPQGCFGFGAPFDMELIPEEEWPDRIRQMEKDKTRISDIMADVGPPPLHQGSSNYCAPFASVDGVIVIESMQGRSDLSEELSAASVAAPLNNYRNTGNWVGNSLDWIVKNGIATLKTWPKNYFANAKYDTAESREDRKDHNVTEWFDGSSDQRLIFRQMMTCLFHRLPCPSGYPWMRHAVNAIDPIMDAKGRTFGIRARNSGLYRDKTGHTEFLGSRAVPSEFFAPRVALANGKVK